MKKLFYLSVSLLFFACSSTTNNEDKKDITSLKKEVMAIHDEVMPKMGNLRRTRKSILLMADSIAVTDTTKHARLMKLSADLDMANEGMMQWMRQYEPELQASEDSLWNYYSSQKEAIQAVSDKMNIALENGQEVIQ